MEPKGTRILVADDEYHICEGLRESLTRAGHVVDVAYDGHEAAERLERQEYDAAILDLKMPGRDGMQLLRLVGETGPETGVIIITAFGEVSTAVDAMRLGAYDYLTKPVDLKRLQLSLQHLLEHQALMAENKQLKARLGSAERFDDIVHRSSTMQRVCDTIDQAAATDVPVLVMGETGTGKELVARAIHHRGSRRLAPLVAVNCGAIPETLFESELFGYTRGAFTGADSDKPGRFEAAEGGTLFLDEVGEIPPQNQVDLLRVLEETAYTPVGSNEARQADVRIIFATNRDLELEVREGRFREDLYYRINVVPIRVPRLSERREDIPLLTEVFFEELCGLHHKPLKHLTSDGLDLILEYPWPGNVRELKNVVERIVVTCGELEVGPDHLPSRIRRSGEVPKDFLVPLGSSIEEVERALIERTLSEVTSMRKEAAAMLGISVRALQYKIKRYGLT
ncbi:MAG: sigma-54 dependent transcriptional regulator [Candidatus Latescibacteria bacterium]|jgi:two-component system response regulator AtoC|nr:sigma-54 dependent transcriptional regulator [Candidatus Latescibacterota bacterium]